MSHFKRFYFACTGALFLVFGALFPAQIFAQQAPAFQQYAADIAQIEYYLANLRSFTAGFTQTSEEGNARGRFYLERPGKMRWEYAPPTPILLVSNGSTLTFFDAELGQTHFVPLDETIAGYLVKTNPKLNSPETELLNFQKHQGHLYATVRQREKPDNGELTMVFSESPLSLRQIIMDNDDGKTTITFANAQQNVPIPADLFIFKDPRGVINRHRNN